MAVLSGFGVRGRLRAAWLLAALAALALIAGGVIASAKVKQGTNGPDRISGSAKSDRLHGKRGRDRINGRGGDDTIKGGRGKDVIRGGRGDDLLIGGKGGDTIIGGPGRDGINMRGGVEIASPGRDKINARDGAPDQINCGDGWDVVKVDAVEEGVYNCEVIKAPKVEGENIG